MKRPVIQTLHGIGLSALLLFSACKKEDTTPPVVTLNGASSMSVELGGTYTEPGATATDDQDGDLSSGITIAGSVNEDMAGNYTLTYTVADAAGNTGTASRSVKVEANRDSYLGNFTVSENCPSPYGLNTAPTISAGASADQISISLFYFNGGTLTCTVDGNNVTIDPGQNPAPWGDNVTGDGSLNAAGNVMTLNLTFSPSGAPQVNCTATYTKN